MSKYIVTILLTHTNLGLYLSYFNGQVYVLEEMRIVLFAGFQ